MNIEHGVNEMEEFKTTKTLALQGIEPNGGGALSSNVSKLGSKEVSKKLRNFSLVPQNDHILSSPLEVEGKCARKSRKIAFTLAEVLITLGIIGVVAALTIPSVIQNYKKQVTVTQLKKAYSTLGQVVQKSIADNGPVGLQSGSKVTESDVKEFFDTYWLPYFKGAQISTVSNPKLNDNKPMYKYYNGVLQDISIYTDFSYGRVFFSTADGTTYYVIIMTWHDEYDEEGNRVKHDAVYTSRQNVYVDINGIKPPNTIGKDVFFFYVDFDKNAVRPWGYGAQQSYVEAQCKETGYSCIDMIMRDGWKINY